MSDDSEFAAKMAQIEDYVMVGMSKQIPGEVITIIRRSPNGPTEKIVRWIPWIEKPQ